MKAWKFDPKGAVQAGDILPDHIAPTDPNYRTMVKYSWESFLISTHGYPSMMITITFPDCPHPEQAIRRRDRAIKAYMKTLGWRERQKFRWVCCSELQKRGSIHFHLMAWHESTPLACEALAECLREHCGLICRVEEIHTPRGAVVSYVLKYVLKDGEGEITFSPNFRRPPMPWREVLGLCMLLIGLPYLYSMRSFLYRGGIY